MQNAKPNLEGEAGKVDGGAEGEARGKEGGQEEVAAGPEAKLSQR